MSVSTHYPPTTTRTKDMDKLSVARMTLDVFLAAYQDRPDDQSIDEIVDDDLLTFGHLRAILAALAQPAPDGEVLWDGLAASFGPVLKAAFPDTHSITRMQAAEALSGEVRKRANWFEKKGDRDDVSRTAPALGVKVRGVGRMFDNDKAVLVMLDRKPTDDELRALHEALTPAPQPAEGAWQPIETAPNDGTAVLLWCQPTKDDAYAIQGWYEGGVFDRRWYDAYSEEVKPSHWQPLPAPPAAAIRGGAE